MKKPFIIAALMALMLPLTAAAQQSLPISMDFENGLGDWTATSVCSVNESGMGINTDAAKTGSNGFRFSSYDQCYGGYDQYLVSPQLQGAGGAQMTFWYNRSNSSTESFSVGYSTTTSDPSAFTWGETVSVSSSGWTEYEYQIPAGALYVAIHYTSNYSYYLYIDDIYIGAPPTCFRVNSFAATQATADEITLIWTDTVNTATYTIYNMADNSVVASGLSGNTYTVTGLTPNTSYTFGIEANCSATDASQMLLTTARTSCVMILSSEMPYHESFSTWTTGTGNLDPCWSDLSYYSTYHPYAYATTGHNGTSDTALYCYAGSNSTPMFAILPAMENVSGMMVSFFAKGATSNFSTIQVGYMTNPSDSSTFTAVASWPLISSNWTYYEAVLPTENMDNVNNVAFRLHNTYSGYGIYIDDIAIAPAPACPRPASLAIRNITSNSAELVIADSTANNNYTVQVAGTTTTTINATDTVVSLTGLTVNTPYTVTVVSNCSDGNTTVPISTSFRTTCVAIENSELPYVMNFDSLPTGAVTADNLSCWTVNSSYSSYPTISSYQSHSGNALQLYGYTIQTVAMPAFEDDLSTLQLSFWHKAYTSWNSSTPSAWVEVGVMSNPSDPSTFTLVQSCQPENSDWTQFEVSFAGHTTGHIAFRYAGTASSNIYIDDITVQELPSCVRPSSVEVSGLTATEATLTINDANNIGAYTVVINDGDSATVYTNTLYIDTLRANTEYTVRVRTLCNDGNPTESFTTVTFRTSCAAMSIPYTADFENDATGATPGCWTNLGGTTNVVSGSSTAHAGSKYLDFRGTNRNMIALPQFAEVVSSLQVHFWTRPENFTNSSCGTLHVGYVTDLADTTTFVSLASYAYNEFSAWDEKEVAMTGAPDGASIAFLQRDCATNYYWYIDDVTVEPIPSCARPAGVSVSDITIDGATVTVTDPAEANSYYYVLAQDGVGDVDSNVVYSTSFDLANLLSNTNYTVSVATYCGDDTTAFVSTSFRTACAAITADQLPWNESFETYPAANGIIPCWNYVGSNANSMSIVATRAHEGSKSYRFSGSATTPHILILPEFEDGISNLMLSFWFVAENIASSGDLLVGYFVQDDSSFTVVDTFHAADYTTMGDAEVTFADAPAGARIAIAQQQASSANYWWWIDDLTVSTATACVRPNDVVVRNVATTTADLWIDDETQVNNYGIAVLNGSDTVQYLTATDTVASLTNLLPGTQYTVSVRSLCATGDSTSSVSASFVTECVNIATLPWTEGFEAWTTGANSFNPCWNRFYQSYGSTNTSYPYVANGGNDGSTNAMLFHSTYDANEYSGATYLYSVAHLPVFDAALSGLTMTFSYKADDPEYTELYVGVSSSTADTSTFTRLLTVTPADNQWHEYDLDFTAYTGTGNRITFVQRNVDGEEEYDYDYGETTTYSSSNGYLDDITVDAIGTCVRPATLVVSDIDDSHATLTWTDPNGTGDYVVVCSNGDSVTVPGALTYTFSNLASGIDYTVGVRRLCNAELTPARTATFRTLATPVTSLPYTTGFETGDDLQWDYVQASGNQWTIGSAAASTGSNSLYVSNDGGASRSYNGNGNSVVYASRLFRLAAGEYSVSFDWSAQGESNYDFLRVFAMPDSLTLTANVFGSANVTTGVPAGWQDVVGGKLNLDTTWSQANGTFAVADSGLYKLVFMWRNDNSTIGNPAAAIDNLTVEALSCPTPTNLTLDTVSANSFTISWTPMGSETSWAVSINSGAWQTVADSSYTATALTSNTDYTYAVRAICGAGDSSFAIAGTVRTECGTIGYADLPWSEDFNSLGTNMNDLTCWNRYAGLYQGDSTALTDATGGWGTSLTAIDGTRHVKLNIYGTNVRYWLVTPTFDIVAPVNLAFDYALTAFGNANPISEAGNDDRFMVLVTTDDGASWTPIATWDSTANAFASIPATTSRDTLSLAAFVGQQVRIAFYGESTVSGGDNDLHIDNIAIFADTNAPQPEMYTVSAASADAVMGSATVSATRVAAGTSVTATATANSGYHFVNWTAAGTVVSTANPYTFTVSADIALTANFEADGTEPEECVDPTDVAASDITSTSATISWTAGGSETRWAINWGTGADTTANNPYTLTGLEPNTTYYVKVKALCADGNESGWSSPATFTTATVGIDDVDAAAISLYPNPATTTVTISGISGQATVTVVDMNGREVHTQAIKHSSNQTITLDLTGYAQGAYFVRIVGEQQSAVRKLIVK